MRRCWKVAVGLAYLLLLFSAGGCGGKEDKALHTAQEYLRFLGQEDFARAKELEVHPARGVAEEKQRADWQTRQDLTRRIAEGLGKTYQELANARLELTSEDPKGRAEATAYWNDMLIHLDLAAVEGKWRVAGVEAEAGEGIRRAGILAIMSQHGQIPAWLDALDPGRDAEKVQERPVWDTDYTWQEPYRDVESKMTWLGGGVTEFAQAVKISAGVSPLDMDPDTAALVKPFSAMVNEILGQVRDAESAVFLNIPPFDAYVPRAKAVYEEWRREYTGQIPEMSREDADGVIDAAGQLLKASGQWNGMIDLGWRPWGDGR